MDVISIYSSGIKNVVSNSGTALTESQINLIWKFLYSYTQELISKEVDYTININYLN